MKTEIIYEGQYGGGCETLSNASAGAWTRIATYGDVPNRTPDGEMVTQRFERADAERIVATFANNWARIKRIFGVGSGDIPVVRGHTDTGNVDEETLADTTHYGRITALEARDDGLYAQIHKSPEFGQLLANGAHLEYSPTWRVAETAAKIFRPFRLISLGMVDKGNLRNATLVNNSVDETATKQKQKNMEEWTDEQKERLASLLGTDASKLGDAEAIIASVSGKLKASSQAATKEPEKVTASNSEGEKKKSEETDEEKKKKKADAKLLVNAAFADETIFASEVGAMTELAERDYDSAKSLIEARRESLKAKPRNATLENAAAVAKQKAQEGEARDARIMSMVNAKIAAFEARGCAAPKAHVLWAECEAELSASETK